MKSILTLIFLALSLPAFSQINAQFDLLYPVSRMMTDGDPEVNTDLRFEYAFHEKFSAGIQMNYISYESDDEGSTGVTGSARFPEITSIIDKYSALYGRWYFQGHAKSSWYLSAGIGYGEREFNISAADDDFNKKSYGLAYVGHVGYQWLLTEKAGLNFEIAYYKTEADESATVIGSNYDGTFEKDQSDIMPKVLLSYQF